MTKTTRRQALALLGGGFLGACTEAPLPPGEGDPFEGGLGGTGIVGTLVGFGSLLVNGLRIEVDARTSYRTVFGPVSLDALEPGVPLTVFARRSKSGYVARSVSVDYTLFGRVHRVGGALGVSGVPVIPESGARGRLVPGMRVAVGGVWTRDGVRASLIAPAPEGPDLVAGTVNPGQGGASFALGSVDMAYQGRAPAPGSYAVALGRAEAGGFLASDVRPGRFEAGVSLGQLSVDGYLEPSARAPGLRIAGLGHSFAEKVQLGGVGARRAVYFGPYDGRFAARGGYVVPDDFGVRAALLRKADLTGLAKIRL